MLPNGYAFLVKREVIVSAEREGDEPRDGYDNSRRSTIALKCHECEEHGLDDICTTPIQPCAFEL